MASVLFIHDDSTISRVAYLLERRKKMIEICESIIRGDKGLPAEYYRVNPDQAKAQLEAEKWALSDLLEDIEDGLFAHELKDIYSRYVAGGNA